MIHEVDVAHLPGYAAHPLATCLERARGFPLQKGYASPLSQRASSAIRSVLESSLSTMHIGAVLCM